MDGVGGYAGWRWIFILEGLLTVAVALVAPFAIHDFPETATFLTEEERRWVIHKLRSQSGRDTTQDGTVHEESRFRLRYVIDALTDWQIYVALFSMFPSALLRRVKRLTDQCTGGSAPLSTVSRTFCRPSSRTWGIRLQRRSCSRCRSTSQRPLWPLFRPGCRIGASSGLRSFSSSCR